MKPSLPIKLLLAVACLWQGSLPVHGISITLNTDPAQLVNLLLGPGIVSVANATYTGADIAAGTFTGGTASGIGIESGIILSTGDARLAPGPNNDHLATELNSKAGDADLDNLAGWDTADAAILEFDFTTTGGTLFFRYVFASDEYSEYANDNFNDVFGFFLDGINVALLPATSIPVSINTVNGGNPPGENPQNQQYFIYNDFTSSVPAPYDLQYDGFTVVFTAEFSNLAPGTHRMKFAIADATDAVVDSAVFLEAGSFRVIPTAVPDAGATLPLMALALGGMGLCSRRWRRARV